MIISVLLLVSSVVATGVVIQPMSIVCSASCGEDSS